MHAVVLLELPGTGAFRGRGFWIRWLKKNRRGLTKQMMSPLQERCSLMNSLQLASALEQTRSIPLDQIASVAMDHKRKLAVVQLHSGTEVQMEVTDYRDLIDKLTELYSGQYVA